MYRRSALARSLAPAWVALVALIAPSTASLADEPAHATEQQVAEIDPLVVEIRRRLAEPVRGAYDSADQEALVQFYADRGSAVWITAGAFSPAAQAAISEIAKADDWGLSSAAFELPQSPGAQAGPSALADAEVKLWLAILKYARHARGGRVDPSQISANLDQKPDLLEPKSIIQSIIATDAPDAYLRSLHPRHPQFERLRQALLKARGASQKPNAGSDAATVQLPEGPNLKPGMQHPDVALLRQRLGLTADASPADIYDQKLEAAVRSYQREQGLPANGVVTARTRASLNGAPKAATSAGPETHRLIVNMERWRWMPEDLGDLYVWDNVPEYMMRVVKKSEVIHSAKIVVGKVDTPTPIFSADMKQIVFHPEWGVPDSIKVKEILPYLRATSSSGFFGFFGGSDTRILDRHRLRVSYNGRIVDASKIDWSRADIRQYQFIQSAGGANVLGVVKFRFPNRHDVYMHDTPERNLFGGSMRAFSHGCMRVQDPGRLAEILLAEDKGWSTAHVGQLLAAGYNNEIELTRPIPVHITYFTLLVSDDGTMKHFGDPYGYDNRISLALMGKPLAPGRAAEPASEPPAREARPTRTRSAAVSEPSGPYSGLSGN